MLRLVTRLLGRLDRSARDLFALQRVWRDAQDQRLFAADFAHVYDRIHAEQPDATILHLAYSEATTCSHQSSKITAQGRDYVFSMDTRFVSVGQSLVVVETAKYIEAHPDATVDEIFAFANLPWTAYCWALLLRILPSVRRAVACPTSRSLAHICSRLSPALR